MTIWGIATIPLADLLPQISGQRSMVNMAVAHTATPANSDVNGHETMLLWQLQTLRHDLPKLNVQVKSTFHLGAALLGSQNRPEHIAQ